MASRRTPSPETKPRSPVTNATGQIMPAVPAAQQRTATTIPRAKADRIEPEKAVGASISETGTANAIPDENATATSAQGDTSRPTSQRKALPLEEPEVPSTLVGLFKQMSQQAARRQEQLNRRRRIQLERRQARRQKLAARQAVQRRAIARRSVTIAARNTDRRRLAPAKTIHPQATKKVAPPPTTQAPVAAKPASPRAARNVRRRGGRSNYVAGFQALPPHKFGSKHSTMHNELLVEQMSPHAMKQLAALGFKPMDRGQPSGSTNGVMRLRTPTGASTQTAYKMIAGLFSSGTVHFNRRYRIYRAAEAAAGWRTTIQTKRIRKCSRERCYGPAIVEWHEGLSRCARGLRIGIIDTAVETQHPTFTGRSITTARIAPGKAPEQNSGHGTGILALLAGSSDSTTPGLVPDAKFYAADIFFADAHGNAMSDSLSLHRALLQMEAWNVQIVNLSLAGPPDSLVKKTIRRLSRKGMMFVAAGGNEGPAAGPSYPAAFEDVIAVTAVDRSLRSYRYANRGDYIDVAAPGVNIWTAAPKRKDGLLSGTSLAAPFVTSIVSAVYRSLPNKSRQDLLDRIATSDLGKPGKDRTFGRGLVRAPVNCRPIKRPPIATAKADGRDIVALAFGNLFSD